MLYSGFDTLDIAFQGFLPYEVLEQLKSAKEAAQKANNPVTIELGPEKIPVRVLGGGRNGGYTYQVNTGPVGVIYAFKDSQNANDWNIFVNIGSAMLLQYGYYGATERILADLKGFGATIGQESINRVDYCFDFLMQDFSPRAEQVIAPPTSTKSGYLEGRSIDDVSAFAFRGRELETLTVGKMPNLQLQIYNKRREVIQKQKPYWFDAWNIDPDDKTKQVWRVEVRAGSNHLKKRWGLRSFQDIENCLGDIVIRAIENIRYLDDDQDYDTVNVSRARLHPLWEVLRSEAMRSLFEYRSGLCPGAIQKHLRNEYLNISKQGIFAYARRLAVSLNLSEEQIIEDLPQIVANTVAFEIANDQERFLEKTYKSQQKVLFIEDDRFDVERYQAHISRQTFSKFPMTTKSTYFDPINFDPINFRVCFVNKTYISSSLDFLIPLVEHVVIS